jgi:hypothetical protein
MGSMFSLPGMDDSMFFGKTVPAFRAVPSAEGTTFEGEWLVPALGDDSPSIRLSIAFLPSPPPRPVEGVVRTFGSVVEVPAR